jgi:UDP-GlcNAc:undecaprenyl-phosphate GlcNAc-1-phosphate transferase
MIDLFIIQFKQLNFLISNTLMFSLYTFAIFFWAQIMLKFKVKNYHALQRVHEGEVPRIGGLISFVGFIFYYSFCSNDGVVTFLESVLISFIPLLVISLKEDFYQNTNALTRVFAMILSCLLFFYSFDIHFPVIEFPGLGYLISSSNIFSWFFFTICIVVIINGNNMIDGANGLMPMTIIMQCISLAYICFSIQDITNLVRLFYVATPVIVFLIFNYPLGKVFMGDLGAYFFGFVISVVTIIIFADNPELPAWSAVIILFYPAMETLFSFCRKIYEKRNPLNPDSNHLHLLIFKLLQGKESNIRICNGLVMPFLSIIWSTPFILLMFIYNSLFFTIIGLIGLIIIYLSLYFSIRKIKYHDAR